jgi:hypothetical protein
MLRIYPSAFVAIASVGANLGGQIVGNAGNDYLFGAAIQYRLLLKFDLSQVTPGAVLSAAIFLQRSALAGTQPAGNSTFDCHPLSRENWTQNGATWAKYDGTNNWSSAGGDFGSQISYHTCTPAINAMDFFVTAQVAAAAGSSSWSVLFKGDVEGEALARYFQAHSMAAALEADRPFMDVDLSLGAGAQIGSLSVAPAASGRIRVTPGDR